MKATNLLSLLSLSALSPAAVTATGDVLDLECEATLVGAERPMLTEKEIKEYRSCLESAVEALGGQDAELEYAEITGQDWTADWDDRSGRRLRQRSASKTRTRFGCRRCAKESLRRLGGGRRGLEVAMDGYDQHMYECLADVSAEKAELAAFRGLTNVENFKCHMTVLAPPLSDVLGEYNGTGVDEEQVCETFIENAQAPMLSEAEMAHYDRCYIEMFNKYHSIGGFPQMVRNEILEQNLTGSIDEYNGRRYLQGKGKNNVKSMRGICTRSDSGGGDLGGRRALQDSQTNFKTFDVSLCECLGGHGEGQDHANEEYYNYFAFDGDIKCTTSCDHPPVSVQEFQVLQQSQVEYFETNLQEKEAVFDESIAPEEAVIKEENEALKEKKAILRAKKDAFAAAKLREEMTFQKYQLFEEREYRNNINKSCMKILSKTGCDGMMIHSHMVYLEEASDLEAMFVVEQSLNEDEHSDCPLPLDGQDPEELLLLFKFPDGNKPKCEDKFMECGDFVDFNAKGCNWDADWGDGTGRMVAEINVLVARPDINPDSLDEDDCDVAIGMAEQNQGFCNIDVILDCGCEAVRGQA